MGFQAEPSDVLLTLGGARDNYMGLNWKLDLTPGTSVTIGLHAQYSTDSQRAVHVALGPSGDADGEKHGHGLTLALRMPRSRSQAGRLSRSPPGRVTGRVPP